MATIMEVFLALSTVFVGGIGIAVIVTEPFGFPLVIGALFVAASILMGCAALSVKA